MEKFNSTKSINDKSGTEIAMIRVDKTVKQMNAEKPQSRWDVHYWHPKFDYLTSIGENSNLLKEYLVEERVISADSVRASRGESYSDKKDKKHPHKYYSVAGILPTGYDTTMINYGSEDAYHRLQRSQLKPLDIAIARSGSGSVGKCFIYLGDDEPNIVSDLYIIRCQQKKVNPFYILLLLKTKMGSDQICRNERGVSGQTKITTDMIEDFLVPKISDKEMQKIENQYLKISEEHNAAIKIKLTESTESKKKLTGATKKLDALIEYVENLLVTHE